MVSCLMQADHYAEEASRIGNYEVTRVSAELKMARSFVRFTEIQSTLEHQRYVSLRGLISIIHISIYTY